MGKNYNWAILGTGVVANEMAQALHNAGKEIYAVGNRTYGKAQAFAEKYQVTKVYEDFHEMFSDPQVDVIYITTPHNTHIGFLREALKNGKHVLCEKAITLNSEELSEAIKLSKENHAVLMEAMTIFHMPVHKKLYKLIHSGQLGKVNMIQLNFGSYKEYDMSNRFFNRKLAGGAMLDIGVYAISLARLYMTKTPDRIMSQVKYAPTGVDEQAGILMMNEDGQMVTISLTLHSKQPKRAMISCDKAYVEIMEYPRAEEAVITYTQTGEREVIREGERSRALQYEMEDMEAAINGEDKGFLNLTIDVMKIMTDIRMEWGMRYPEEENMASIMEAAKQAEGITEHIAAF